MSQRIRKNVNVSENRRYIMIYIQNSARISVKQENACENGQFLKEKET